MSNELAVSMDELDQESAELLPSRETLNVYGHSHGASSYTSFAQVGYGNTTQSGLFNVAIANGSLDNILSFGSGGIIP